MEPNDNNKNVSAMPQDLGEQDYFGQAVNMMQQVHCELGKTQDEFAMQIDVNEAGLKHLLDKKDRGTSGQNTLASKRISQLTTENLALTTKKKLIEEMEEQFYAGIIKNGAVCLAMNANIETVEPEAKDYRLMSVDDWKEFEALKLSHKELVSKHILIL